MTSESWRGPAVDSNEDVAAVRALVGPCDLFPAAEDAAHRDPRGQGTLRRILSTKPPGPRVPSMRGRRLGVIAQIAMAAVAVALVGSFALRGASGGGSAAFAATPQPLTYFAPLHALPASQLLMGLADVAARQPPLSDGRYAYVKTLSWYLDARGGSAPSSAVVPQSTETWRAPDGSGRTVIRTGAFLNEPAQVDDQAVGRGRLDVPWNPALLSTQAPVLARQLAAGHPLSNGPAERFAAARDLAREGPIPPGVQAALLRVLAAEPSLVDRGSVIDRAGRHGAAVSVDSTYSGLPTRYTLIFDPSSGALLGSEAMLTATSGALQVHVPAIVEYTTILEARTVAEIGGTP